MGRFRAIAGSTMLDKDIPFQIGDLVRSEICGWTSDVIRRVIRIEKDSTCLSGYRVFTDGGHACQNSKRADPLNGIDSTWFELVDNCKFCEENEVI